MQYSKDPQSQNSLLQLETPEQSLVDPSDVIIPSHKVPDQESSKRNDQEDGKEDVELPEGIVEVLTKLLEYGETAEDYSEWDKERMDMEYRDEGEPDWSTMVCESFEEFEAERYEEIVEALGNIKLYDNQPKFQHSDIFKDQFWHPGFQDQSKHACLIHSINLYVGGPLFDSAQKFLTLYQSRCHMKKQRSPEFPWERGLSFKNLRKIIYLETQDKWLSPEILHTVSMQLLTKVLREA